MSRIADAWRSSPHVRALARSVVVAGVTYILSAIQDEQAFSLAALGFACASAAGTYLIGWLTPVEPFIGPRFAKPDNVEVPKPPAKPKPASAGS